MLVYINGAKCVGIDAIHITVEVDVSAGVGLHLVGLGDVAVKESLLRVTTALVGLGYKIPGKKIVINLAPADMHKQGSGFDLPIAAAIMLATEQLDVDSEQLEAIARNYLIMGELGLEGSVRKINGALPMVSLAKSLGLGKIILPLENAMGIIDYCDGLDVYGVNTLPQVLEILSGQITADGYIVRKTSCPHEECHISSIGFSELSSDGIMDFNEIIGQSQAKRGMEIASAGGHNIILVGSPGSGKSSLAKAMCRILPPMTPEESLVTRKIYSVAGIAEPEGHMRPFRNPHYSASLASIIGGGSGSVAPGEISLAHNGVLFMDEFCETPKQVIEALRAPMEDGKVTISRLKAKVDYPARFTLVAATNPCPCGYYGEGSRCTCSRARREQYLSRLSGPILDRIDLQIWVHPIDPKKLGHSHQAESSAEIAARVIAARKIQERRFDGEGIHTNGQMNNAQVSRFCPLSPESRQALESIMSQMKLSVRAYFRIIKVARTIADLECIKKSPSGEDREIPILPEHLLEAASFRFLDKPKTA